MFPRLHVNDKEKGGPRAPPRNKMALYEQFSIPSQRFSQGLLPPNSLQSSSSKTDNNLDQKISSQVFGGSNFGSLGTQIVQEKREGDFDDCSVPVFVQSGMGKNVTKREKIASSATPKSFNQQLQGERDSGRGCIFSLDTNSKEYTRRKCKVNGSQDQELEHLAVSTLANDNAVGPEILSCSDENHANPKELDDVYVKGGSPEKNKIDRIEAVSEVSMVDSISCSDISPNDIVALIGQRRFWKARETITNQQRVFAFQLFELHRLIKVQQLIAKSPQLFVEDNFFLKSSTLKDSPTTKRSSKYIEKFPLPVMSSEISRKSNRKMECSSENAVGDSKSLHFRKNGHYSGTSQTVHSMADRNTGSWCFPHSSPHQWLIPMMSPSEGLVYKPCPAPAFIGTFPPPYGPSQSMSSFANPTQENGQDQPKSRCRSGSNCQPSCSSVRTKKRGIDPSVVCSTSELQPRNKSCNSVEKDQTHHSGVIKVIPRNPRSAVESAARIFQSIQEERKLQSM